MRMLIEVTPNGMRRTYIIDGGLSGGAVFDSREMAIGDCPEVLSLLVDAVLNNPYVQKLSIASGDVGGVTIVDVLMEHGHVPDENTIWLQLERLFNVKGFLVRLGSLSPTNLTEDDTHRHALELQHWLRADQ